MEKENPLKLEKKKKLQNLRESGQDPYPHNYKPTHFSKPLLKTYETLEAGEKSKDKVCLAGRLMTHRSMGKASFFHLQDEEGKIQCYLKVQELSETDQVFYKNLDIGDIVGVKGFVFKTRKGEVTVHCEEFQILCKSIEPLPEKFHGLTDTELCYRLRHLDLIMNAEKRDVFKTRSKIISSLRGYLNSRDFLEVETPVLQPIYGGAAAAPFSTHHRTLDQKLFMKISPEIYLKRIVVGGFNKVYEIGKNFRNEGIDRSHNPEFTMLEFYEAYTDYEDQMRQVEELVSYVAKEVKGDTKITYQEKTLDFKPPWRRLTIVDGLKEYAKLDVEKMSEEEMFKKLKEVGSVLEKPSTKGEMILELFEFCVEPHLWEPTFIMDYPVEVSPLTKKHRSKEGFVERFEVFAAGMELGNSYTELNDPEDQKERLQQQESKRVIDNEAHPMDMDFLHAIEVGLPPTGGVGIGVERLVMLLTDSVSIRDVIFFPILRKKLNVSQSKT